ncbi:hypothetical protein SBD_5997 [Streptomyces bottropensis ATCC 25435]|uniref:Uncharacterized protein n=1 Tax=Streptomyces bottropensis ATCC 25435 TaxID=1054862 RepID=M3E9S2_9ACTN|nr:hypothetical protein SBD_5997 [Streptomyces bottropensis ATCC 25435]
MRNSYKAVFHLVFLAPITPMGHGPALETVGTRPAIHRLCSHISHFSYRGPPQKRRLDL